MQKKDKASLYNDWFLIRGLGREQKHWGSVPDLIGRMDLQSRIHCLDLPGVGVRLAESSPCSISKIVDGLRPFQQQLDQGAKKIGLGLSLGGMVLLDWVLRYPKDWDLVVLMNTSVGYLSSWKERINPVAGLSLLWAAIRRSVESREECVLKLVSNHEQIRNDTLPHWVQIAKSRPIRSRTIFAQLFAGARFKPKLESLSNKVVLLASQNDALVSSNCSRQLSQATGWPVFFNATAGHDLGLDDPHWVLQTLKPFI